ncbi:DUF3592 domain-containing protein [Arenibacter sp. GZD96]|uniref:DUF3592 domain-containing protein n=1 Tax=Aurantibrevibacter litoralis TaxID=3106030 RepID=UPI002AFF5CE0|nr:DUF3592 domain-containing protein [Arenibacter sp. GZD-96]MEA1787520.1 DUF3592 domain-containing protein [Arenibacter sp. GZD-96]
MSQAQASSITVTKITKPLAKGCGCFTVVFLVLFVWGIWSTITSYNSLVELEAKVIDFVQQETVFLDARYTEVLRPVVSYEYKERVYTDTIHYTFDNAETLEIDTLVTILINPDQPEFTVENGSSTLRFYFVFLGLAALSFLGYKVIRRASLKYAGDTAPPLGRSQRQAPLNMIPNKEETTTKHATPPTKAFSTSSKEKIQHAPLWLSMAIGIGLVLGGLGMGYYKYSGAQTAKILNKKGVQIKGIVAEVDRSSSSEKTNRRDFYTINYHWETVPYTYKTSSKFARYGINEELVMLVNPDNPSEAMLLSSEDIHRGSYLFALFLMVMGVLICYYQYKQYLVPKSL